MVPPLSKKSCVKPCIGTVSVVSPKVTVHLQPDGYLPLYSLEYGRQPRLVGSFALEQLMIFCCVEGTMPPIIRCPFFLPAACDVCVPW